ncbi:MAG TPA: YcxB family protein [Micromonosporaceae bacterium]|nr:YcxB family protein [Micromonosporaceae bacterium]
MHIEFTAARDRQYMIQLARTVTARARRSLVVMGVFLMVASLPGLAGEAWAVLASLLVFLVGFSLVMIAVRLVGSLVGRMPEHMFTPRSYVLTPEKLRVVSQVATHEYRWEAFRVARPVPFGLLLRLAGQDSYGDIPRSGCTDEEWAQLGEFLAQHRLLRAGTGSGTMSG